MCLHGMHPAVQEQDCSSYVILCLHAEAGLKEGWVRVTLLIPLLSRAFVTLTMMPDGLGFSSPK